jgi:hypothetical protein
MSDLSFKKFVQFVELDGEPSDEQINEIFGLFRNNQKLDKLKKEREKLKGMSDAKKKALDQALADFASGKKKTQAQSDKGVVSNDDLDAALGADDRKFLAKRDRLAIEGLTEEAKVKAFKLQVDLSKFGNMKPGKIEDLIFGEDEGDDSWAQNQDVVTIEYIKLKGNVLYVYPMWDDIEANVQRGLQRSYDSWQRKVKPSMAESVLTERRFRWKQRQTDKKWVVCDPEGGDLPGYGLFDEDGVKAKVKSLNE